jgi:uncharacterized RDD family membrane protein YckC
MGQAEAPAGRILMAGDEQAAWLAFQGEPETSWRVSVRTLGGEQRQWSDPLRESFTGVRHLAAAERGAVLFFEGGGLMRLFAHQPDGRVGVKPPPEMWRMNRPPLASCPARDSVGDILILVRRRARPGPTGVPSPATSTGPATITAPATAPVPAATAPATSPTTATASAPAVVTASAGGAELAILRYAGNQWSEVATLPGRIVPQAEAALDDEARSASALMACHEDADTVHVLLRGTAWRHWRLRDGEWSGGESLDTLPGRPVALVSLEKDLALIVWNADGRAAVATWSADGWGPWSTLQAGGEPIDFASGPPGVARFGSSLVAAWMSPEGPQSGRFGPGDGTVTVSPLEVFDGPLLLVPAETAQTILMFVSVALLLVLIVWPGRTRSAGEFTLPEAYAPTPLARRLLAGLLDLLPFSLLGVYLVAGTEMPEFGFGDALAGRVPEEAVYAQLVALPPYVIYCFLAEYMLGTTLAKRALRLRVVGREGGRATMREVAMRNIARVPELLFVPLLIFMFLTRYHRRVGDWLAGTAVVDATVHPDSSEPYKAGPGGPVEPDEGGEDGGEESRDHEDEPARSE